MSIFLLVLIITLSTYTHMWNPAGFLLFHSDESIYVERGVGILNNDILYGIHDHPFFGQTVLAGFMHVTSYRGLIDDPATDPSHLEALFAYPRTFMGLLAVLDTLLVYLIADRMFGRKVAAVSAVIFAVAPMSLLLRLVMLDSILLPFVLASVLLALYSRGSGRRHLLLLASGACLGLAIFTKVPAIAMIPPCAILAYWASRRIRDVGVWLAPVLVIPAVWPAYAARAGQFDAWIRDVAHQAGKNNEGFLEAARLLFWYDPILVLVGVAGFAFVVICTILCLVRGRGVVRDREWQGCDRMGGMPHKSPPDHHPVLGEAVHTGLCMELCTTEPKNLWFLIAWFSSILLFFGMIGYVTFYHLVILVPVLCIASAILILRGAGWLLRGTGTGHAGDRTVLIAVTVIGLAGLLTTGVMVSLDVRSSEFEAASFLLQNYSDEPDTVKVVSPLFHLSLSNVYGMQNTAGFFHDSEPWDLVAATKPRIPQNTTGGFSQDVNPIHGIPSVSDPAIPNEAGSSYHYVPPDAEKVVLMIGNHDKKFLESMLEGCDYTADNVSVSCPLDAYTIMRVYNEGSLIKEFDAGVSLDAFPPLPLNVERHLVNPSFIIEWNPTK